MWQPWMCLQVNLDLTCSCCSRYEAALYWLLWQYMLLHAVAALDVFAGSHICPQLVDEVRRSTVLC
jgi:hypothetical protein